MSHPGDWLGPLLAAIVIAAVLGMCANPSDANTIDFDRSGAPTDVTYEACTASGCVTGPVTTVGSVSTIAATTPRGAISWVEAVGYGQRVHSVPDGARRGACAWDLDGSGVVELGDFGAGRRGGFFALVADFGAFRRVWGDACG